jgi:hypothetical protein
MDTVPALLTWFATGVAGLSGPDAALTRLDFAVELSKDERAGVHG